MSTGAGAQSAKSTMNDEHQPLGFLLHDVARLLRKRFEHRAKYLGLTNSQWKAIGFLAKNEGIHQAALADLLEVEPITLVRTLDRLAQRGLVERRQDPNDRRTWLLYLKEAARPLLRAAQPLGEATRAEALSGLSDEDRDRLLQALATMKTNLTAACRAPAAEKEAYYG